MPNRNYKPHIGSNVPSRVDQYGLPHQMRTYANLDRLNRDLQQLLDITGDLIRVAEEDLASFDLRVSMIDDPTLAEAHNAEWPSSLGAVPAAVGYSYYKTLRLRNTATAKYVRKRYEEAVRDVAGTVSLDLVILANLLRNEVYLVQEFVDSTIRDVDDTSEFRILEILQDWVQSGIGYANSLRSIFQQRNERSISLAEAERATASEAREAQAVSKARLNSFNKLLVQELDALQRSFSEFSEVFYKKNLKPAMDYRLSIGRRVHSGDFLQENIDRTSRILDDSVKMLLADEKRRKEVFERKVKNCINIIQKQIFARNSIHNLAHKGMPVPQSGLYVMYDSGVSNQYPYEDLERAMAPYEAESSSMIALHSSLRSLDADDHPQYLLRSGGVITGDVLLDENGLIDGIKPSEHRHTGEDGSPRISGADIIGGTLSDDAVDPERKPPTPTELTFIKYTGSVNSGLVDASISWYGDSRYSYEIQVARLEGDEEIE